MIVTVVESTQPKNLDNLIKSLGLKKQKKGQISLLFILFVEKYFIHVIKNLKNATELSKNR